MTYIVSGGALNSTHSLTHRGSAPRSFNVRPQTLYTLHAHDLQPGDASGSGFVFTAALQKLLHVHIFLIQHVFQM